MPEHPPLTTWDATALAYVLDTTRVTKVAYAREDLPILYGTARCVVDSPERMGSIGSGDVRDGFLRITTQGGMEVAFAITELMAAHREGRFMQYDW